MAEDKVFVEFFVDSKPETFNTSLKSVDEDEDESYAMELQIWNGNYTGRTLSTEHKKYEPENTSENDLNKIKLYIEREVIRFMILIIDVTESMLESDFRPNRITCCLSKIKQFIEVFFLHNLLSQMGLVAISQKKVILEVVPTSSPQVLINKLTEITNNDCKGVMSLQIGLQRSLKLLDNCPPYGFKEILILFGSISTFDLGDIRETLKELSSKDIRVSAISFAPELYILKEICEKTSGHLYVVQNIKNLISILMNFRLSPKKVKPKKNQLILMAFPKLNTFANPILCTCHCSFSYQVYSCPRCYSKICKIPTICKVCKLHLANVSDVNRIEQQLQLKVVTEKIDLAFDCHMCKKHCINECFECKTCYSKICSRCNEFLNKYFEICVNCYYVDKVKSCEKFNAE